MSKGIMMFSFGKRGYSMAAYNMALSIKFFNPGLHITLYHDKETLSHLSNHGVFDEKILLEQELIYPNGIFDPGFIKTRLYDFCPYDETIYLDVDGLCLQDPQPIFDAMKGIDHMVHVYDSWTIDKGRDFPGMVWAWCDDLWKHYNLPDDAILPASNSSIQFFRKGEKCKELWDQVKKNYQNKMPLGQLRWKWGGTQPDELYLNVAMAQLGWKQEEHFIFLGDKHSTLSLQQIEQKYYFLSIYGGKGFTKLIYIEWYQRLTRAKFKSPYKVHSIIADKHCNTRKQPTPIEQARARLGIGPAELQSAAFKISDSVAFDSESFLQNYKNQKGGNIKVTNWLNPTFIKFKDRIIFVYRMESNPWCSTTKLGICKVADWEGKLTAFKDSSKLLEVHSDLSGYGKGFHVEDPRLFIQNDELYLSYTDGYQMAQAKIDYQSLTATESFYIKKPARNRTEKNWTFFSHEGSLYAVYQIAPHTIFKMDGANWSTAYEENFKHSWKWGELRGGTSPIKTDDGYLSFFHSSIWLQGDGRQYFMGAYLFDLNPPFAPIAISKEPILAGEMISTNIPRLSNKIYVIFPGGVLVEKGHYKVAFGFNDYQCRYIEIKKDWLKENLIAIKQPELIEA